jgi:hypothetical protein
MNAWPVLITRAEQSRLSPRIGVKSGLEPSMIGFDGIVCVLLIEHSCVGRGSVGGHLARAWAVLKGAGEEAAGGHQIPFLGDQHVDDLPELINRPVQIDPPSGGFHIRLVHDPPVTGAVPAGAGRVDQQRREPLHSDTP